MTENAKFYVITGSCPAMDSGRFQMVIKAINMEHVHKLARTELQNKGWGRSVRFKIERVLHTEEHGILMSSVEKHPHLDFNETDKYEPSE